MLNYRQVRWKRHVQILPGGIGHKLLAFPEQIVMMGSRYETHIMMSVTTPTIRHFSDLLITKAVDNMIVYQACSLHERITYGWSDKFKSSFFKIRAHRR